MTAPVTDASSTIKEIEPEMVHTNKYNIAMTILEKDASEGDGMVIMYRDYEDKMSRLQFADYIQGLSSVSKMISVLNVYRPELLDKIMEALEEPTNGPAGAQPGVTSLSS
jgi:hypothetical protein